MALTTKLLLMGRVGQGKSTLGNFIVKDPNMFHSNPGLASTTMEAKVAEFEYNEKKWCVIDTPGLCDAEEVFNDNAAMLEIAKGIKLSFSGNGKPGVDAVLLVLSAAERFGCDHEELLTSLEKLPGLWPYVIVVFTNADRLDGNDPDAKLQEILQDPRASPQLKLLMKKAEGQYILINAKDTSVDNYERKMKEIVTFVGHIQEKEKCEPYTSELFEKAAKEIISNREVLEKQGKELETHKNETEMLRSNVQMLNRNLQSARQSAVQYRPQVVVKEIHHHHRSDDDCRIL